MKCILGDWLRAPPYRHTHCPLHVDCCCCPCCLVEAPSKGDLGLGKGGGGGLCSSHQDLCGIATITPSIAGIRDTHR